MQRLTAFSTVALLTSVFSLTGCRSEQPESIDAPAEIARPAKIVKVSQNRTSLVRTYPGTLGASEHVDLSFRVGGQLIELPVQPGQRVKKGELLAQLDEADYRNSFTERQARFELAQIQFDQISKLRSKNLASKLQHDQASAEMKSARAALSQARDNLDYTRLVAPFDGVVAKLEVENYQSIQAKSPVLELQDDSRIDIHFSVPESLITNLKRTDNPQQAMQTLCGEARFYSQPGKAFKACYKEHDATPDPLTRSFGSVFTLVEQTDFPALPGMSASISVDLSAFVAEQPDNSLLVPLEAVFENQDKRWIWQVDGQSRARLSEVKVGRLIDDQLEIHAGLDSDSRIIAAGVSYVRDGMLVKPMVKERGL
ncbi:efflux RND transporter periplasmic adaptor subunit [Motiliproteus sp.]|uniref:efflux RND transporter periplasmic adaptor subunit n=1 Tax=Motiliproteus sp. TaxID=1898955 RepID=UPI003BAAB059